MSISFRKVKAYILAEDLCTQLIWFFHAFAQANVVSDDNISINCK